MTVYLRTSEVIGLPVVKIIGGEGVAEVRDVIYSSEAGTLLGSTVNKRGFLRGRMRAVLPATSVAAIGTNAVVTESGARLGTVTDLVLAVGGRGEIVGYELRRDGTKEPWFIPHPTQIAVSGDAFLVPDSVEQYVSHDLSGFALTVDRYRTEVV